MEPDELTGIVRQAALDLGFSLVGIASARPFGPEADRYDEWIQLGYNAALGYMARNGDKRRDPELILPGVQSVVVVAQNYYTPHEHEEQDGVGKISRYAWGDDYHEVIPPKLERLSEVLRSHVPEVANRYYTDTGPVLEKQWAVRAGIGWQGKNGNIISRVIGSWFFLGVMFTTARLVPDSPVGDFCGTCTACIDACPTDAIVAPSVVDAGKCLSYWTIEAKPDVDIPLPIASNMQGWVFGCDICQDVCPWNRFRKPTAEERFLPRGGETTLSFRAIEDFVQEEFSARFRKSPVKRTKMAGLRRNAAALVKGRPPGAIGANGGSPDESL